MTQVPCAKCGAVAELDGPQESYHCPQCLEETGPAAVAVSPRAMGAGRRRLTWLLVALACGIALLMTAYNYFGWGPDEAAVGGFKAPLQGEPHKPSGRPSSGHVS
jgi:hypothetical protein